MLMLLVLCTCPGWGCVSSATSRKAWKYEPAPTPTWLVPGGHRGCHNFPGMRGISKRYCCTILTECLRAECLSCCTTYRVRLLQWWRTVLFSNESRFLLNRNEDRTRINRRLNEFYDCNCVLEVDRFGGGSTMVLAEITHNRTEHIHIPGNLNAMPYRDVILCRFSTIIVAFFSIIMLGHIFPMFVGTSWISTTFCPDQHDQLAFNYLNTCGKFWTTVYSTGTSWDSPGWIAGMSTSLLYQLAVNFKEWLLLMEGICVMTFPCCIFMISCNLEFAF